MNKETKLILLFLVSVVALFTGVFLLKSPIMLFVLTVILMILWWWVLNPKKGLFFLILLMPLQRSIFANYGLKVYWIVIILLMAVLFYQWFNCGINFDLERNWFVGAFFLFFVYIFSSLYIQAIIREGGGLLVDPRKGGGVANFRFVLQSPFIFCIIICFIRSKEDIYLVMKYSLILFGLVCAESIYEILIYVLGKHNFIKESIYNFCYSDSIKVTEYGAKLLHGYKKMFSLGGIYSGWTGAAQLGNFLTTFGLILFPYFFYKTKTFWQKTVLTALLFLSIVCLFFSRCFGNYLALAIGLIFLLYLCTNSKRKVLYLCIVGLTLILGLWIVLLYPSLVSFLPFNEKIQDVIKVLTGQLEIETRSFWIRVDLIKAGLSMFFKSPFLGIGFSNFGKEVLKTNYAGVFEHGGITYSHNSYVLILSELGLFGIVWFLLFIYKVLKAGVVNLRILRKNKDLSMTLIQIGLISAIVANLVFFLDYGSWLFNLNFWFPIGLIIGLNNILKKDKELAK